MCFSATASFTAGALLLGAGTASLTRVIHRRQLPFACIPMLFGMQQISEGLVWLAVNRGYPLVAVEWAKPAVYAFLIFAWLIWPVWVPLSIGLIERKPRRKQNLKLFLAAGSLLSCWLLYALLRYPVEVSSLKYHLHYEILSPFREPVTNGLWYIAPTVFPTLFSTDSRVKALGFVIFVSFLVSVVFFRENVVTVWCFFAAIISVLVFQIMQSMYKEHLSAEVR